MMGLQVISMGGSLTENEVTEGDLLLGEVLLLGEEVLLLGTGEALSPQGDGMGKTLMMTTSVIDLVGEVVEILKLVAIAGLEQEVKAVGMIG